METFRWVSVVISIILGFGITRLLTSAITVFRARGHCEFDWIPLIWASVIFLELIAFWWSLEELAHLVQHWTLGLFLLLVVLVLLLFLASALVLPALDIAEGESLRKWFELDGRWALPAISAFHGIAILANALLWNESLASKSSAINIAVAIVPMVAFFGARRVREIATAVHLPLAIKAFLMLSPSSY